MSCPLSGDSESTQCGGCSTWPWDGGGGVGPPLCAGRLILDGTFKSSSRGAGCRVGIQREREGKEAGKEGSYGKLITWLCRGPGWRELQGSSGPGFAARVPITHLGSFSSSRGLRCRSESPSSCLTPFLCNEEPRRTFPSSPISSYKLCDLA